MNFLSKFFKKWQEKETAFQTPYELERWISFHVSPPLFNCVDRANLAASWLRRHGYGAIIETIGNFDMPYKHAIVVWEKDGQKGRLFLSK